jgi:hypothetical protein
LIVSSERGTCTSIKTCELNRDTSTPYKFYDNPNIKQLENGYIPQAPPMMPPPPPVSSPQARGRGATNLASQAKVPLPPFLCSYLSFFFFASKLSI